MKIKTITAREIIASGGYPTVEAEVMLENGVTGTASVPYGASAGSYEASVLMDGDDKRWGGQGMLRAVENIEQKIAPALAGVVAEQQRELDQKLIELDGAENKSNLGGNALLAVSLASARAAARVKQIPLYRHIIETYELNAQMQTLPQPMVVVIEGGKHADKSTDLQEYCLTAAQPNLSVRENLRMILETYHQLRSVLKKNNLSTNVGNEGAFAPSGITSNEVPFDYMLEAIRAAGYKAGDDIGFSVDAAASEFYRDGKYHLTLEGEEFLADGLIDYYQRWLERYPILTMEDPLAEDDWEHWSMLLPVIQEHKAHLIGDDLTVTKPKRLQTAIDKKAINGILIKLNQIGTLTETIDCCNLAKQHQIMTVTSHRGGGETNDTAMIDVAVAVGSTYVKVGPTRGERVVKYNRLMEIERELASTA